MSELIERRRVSAQFGLRMDSEGEDNGVMWGLCGGV